MTAEELEKMQADSRKRHRAIFGMGVIMPVEEPRTYTEAVEEKPKSLSGVIDAGYEFYDGSWKKKRKKEFFPDLMAAQLSLPCTSEKTEEVPVIKKQESMNIPEFSKPHVPKPVQKKEIIRSKNIPLEPEKRNEERPPAVYSNSKSPYGIYDELKEEWNKKTG